MSREIIYDGPSIKPHDVGVAVAVLVCQADEFLLLQRKGAEGEGTWGTPGGGLEFKDESLREAAARELFEETDIKVFADDLIDLGVTDDKHPDKPLRYITHRFATRSYIGVPKVKEVDKCTDIGWFRLQDLPDPMFEFTHNDLKREETRRFIKQF